MSARPAGSAASWAAERERSSVGVLKLMSWIALHCGRRLSRLVLHLICAYFVLFAPAARRASARYLARVHGRPARWRELYDHVFCFAATILDRVYFLRRQTDWLRLSVRGSQMLEDVLAEGKGAFLIGAHVGSFEVLRVSGFERPGLDISMVMYPDNARKINTALAAIAPDAVPNIIALGRPESMLQIRDRLAEGALVGMLADRTLHAESNRGQPVRLPFLGDEVEFSDGPFRLADLLRQRIVFMVGLYLGGARYEVRFEPLADFRQRPADAAAREARIHAAVAEYVRRLESLCREQPSNWFNFHDFWRDDEGR
jgi:predicted LPLAT superfamily acyltransferase